MQEGNIDTTMFAPCGMNCQVCYKHCYHKKPCAGCLNCDIGKPEHCRKCKIKDCVKLRGISFCYECIEFPCKQILSLEKSYRTRYQTSLIENSECVKINGLDVFMEIQKARYTCTKCGGIISLHDRECSECQAKIDEKRSHRRMNMTETEMWEAYLIKNPTYQGVSYDAWCYGSDTPDLLAELTLAGVKTATASAYPFYEYEQCDLPKIGDHNIILNLQGQALCITKTTRVTVVPFLEVRDEQAYKEGEGDKSLAYWRNVHALAFSNELAEINKTFSEDMLVVCEEFQVVFTG